MAPETELMEITGACSVVGDVAGELKGDENHESHDDFGLVLGLVADLGVGGPEEVTDDVEQLEPGRSSGTARKADGNMLG